VRRIALYPSLVGRVRWQYGLNKADLTPLTPLPCVACFPEGVGREEQYSPLLAGEGLGERYPLEYGVRKARPLSSLNPIWAEHLLAVVANRKVGFLILPPVATDAANGQSRRTGWKVPAVEKVVRYKRLRKVPPVLE